MLARQLAYQVLPPASDGGTLVDGQEFWWIGAVSPATPFPNVGIQAVIEEVDSLPPGGRGCFSCWASETLDNGFWGQVGFAACHQPFTAVTTFYQVWDLNQNPQVLLVDTESEVIAIGQHSYAMTLESGTTWTFTVDGSIFGRRNMGAASSNWSQAISTLCEEGDGVTAPFVPPQVSIPVAMSLLGSGDGGVWFSAPAADLYNSAGLSGAQGNIQDGGIPLGALVIGGGIPYSTPGTALWSGTSAGFGLDAGPAGATPLAPPLLTLTSPAPNAVVGKTITLSGSIENPAGGANLMEASLIVDDHVTETQIQSWDCVGGTCSAPWDTTQVPNGAYDVALRVVDVDLKATFTLITVTVENAVVTSGSGGTGGGAGPGSGTSGGTASSGGQSTGRGSSGAGCSSAEGAGSVALVLALLFLAEGRRRSRKSTWPDSSAILRP